MCRANCFYDRPPLRFRRMVVFAAYGLLLALVAFVVLPTTVLASEVGRRYDDDRNGYIEGGEVIAAVRDYFNGELSAEDVLEVVRLYFDEDAVSFAVSETEPLASLHDTQNMRWLAQSHPSLYRQVAGLPWVEDGLTETERDAIDELLYIGVWDTRSLEAALGLPWVQDAISDVELDALDHLSDIGHYGSQSLETALGLPWVQDAIADVERDALDQLRSIGYYDPEVLAAIIPMPFLQVLDITDVLALRSIRSLGSDGALAALVEHPVFQDGISEDETTLVAAVGTMSKSPSDVSLMLDPGYASIESFSIATPLSPIVLVSIAAAAYDADSHAADAIVDAAPFVESAMLLPLPVEHLILVLHDAAVSSGAGAAGTNHGFAFGYRPKYDQPPDTFEGRYFPGGIVHEIAHYYWSGNEGWIDEGLANTIERMHGVSNGLSPGQLRTRRQDCEAHDLEMLSEWDPPISDSRYICNYYLGERLFFDLREDMEDAEFSERLRELYQMTLGGQEGRRKLGIAEVRQVFAGQAAIVEKHWSGSLNAPENRPFDEGIDRSSHDLILWDQHPTSAGHPEITVTFKGTLLNDAVLSQETNAAARQGGEYTNFTLRPANDYSHTGFILPPLNDGRRTWTLNDPGDSVAVVYELHDRAFTVKFTFPPALGSPSDYVVVVWGFQNETRTPTIGDAIDALGYARIREG